jgi:lipoate-protein ligase A
MGNIQHLTFNIQRPTAEPTSEPGKSLDVENSTLGVECSNWFLLNSGSSSAAFNMALDEALLEASPGLGKPVLRFYGWTERAASFGYFQKFSEVERMTLLRPLVRRPTGGGLVSHDADWTYSLIFPPADSWYALKAVESYRRVHEWIQAAFAKLGMVTELAECCRKALPGQCFVGHEKFDVLWQGQKIAGAAQRRTRSGLLIQGSVQPPTRQVTRADWQAALGEVAAGVAGVGWVEFPADAKLNERVGELIEQKYSQAAYNQKR